MTQPKKIDLSKLTDEEMSNLDALIKKLVEREKYRADNPSAHANDHRSSHSNAK